LSGSHLDLVPETIRLLRADGVDVPVVVGGIIPEADQPRLLAAGVSRIYTPKDFRLADIMSDLADLALERRETAASGETSGASGASSSATGSEQPMKRP
jgi:(2R)-ethylmalonyl-CoA mutase